MSGGSDRPKTAFITGASSGLGAEFARQLAAQGYHLVLSARRTQRLEALAAELQARHAISATTITADLSGKAGINLLEEYITAMPALHLLVNNAGFGTNGAFHQVEPAMINAMVQVHVVATVNLTRAALPGMLARRSGSIINVASIAGFLPLRDSLYGSTKAFVITFSETLARELASSGVHIQALCPGFTITEFHETPQYKEKGYSRNRIPAFMWLNAADVVRTSLADLERRRVISVHGWQYRLATALARNSFTYGLIKVVAASRFRK